MSYASFTNSPASTKLLAHSMAGRTISTSSPQSLDSLPSAPCSSSFRSQSSSIPAGGAVSAEAARLQQRAHSPAELQINDREGGRRQIQACHQARPTGDPTGTLHTPYNIDELPPLFNVLVRVVSIDGGFWQRWSIVAWSCFAQRLPAKHLMPKRLVAMPIDAAPASFANRTSPHTST